MSLGPAIFEGASPCSLLKLLSRQDPPQTFPADWNSVEVYPIAQLTFLYSAIVPRTLLRGKSKVIAWFIPTRKDIIQKLIQLVEKDKRCCSKGRGQENVVTDF